MTNKEKRLLIALVKMTDQYLSERDARGARTLDLDSLAMSAGEWTLDLLAKLGLVQLAE